MTGPAVRADRNLARRLELAEGSANAMFVEGRRRLFPESEACWAEFAGAKAMFDGVGSPITQSFGLGLSGAPSEEDFLALQDFFLSRGADVNHEVCPIGAMDLLAVFRKHGYSPVELSTVLFQELPCATRTRAGTGVTARVAAAEEQEQWIQTALSGWSEYAAQSELMQRMISECAQISFCRDDALSFLAEKDGRLIATGSMILSDGVAVLAGASTIPEARRQGAQNALLDVRLQEAAARDCDLAMMVTEPGSASQRNAERNGFRIAYTRTKWALPCPAVSDR